MIDCVPKKIFFFFVVLNFLLMQRLFFLNGEQDLSTFLLVDIGLAKYPNYVCHASHQIFSDRGHLLQYEEVTTYNLFPFL